MPIVAVDLFCGVGGLTHGLQLAGIPVVAGFDIEDLPTSKTTIQNLFCVMLLN